MQTTPSSFDTQVEAVRSGVDARAAAQTLAAEMTEAELLACLHGTVPFWPGRGRIMEHGYNFVPFEMSGVPRLGVPEISFIDGPRGAVVGPTTAFPVSMARGASWDPALEEEVGRAIGVEVRASGGNLFGGVCINLPRHPAWGRAQETYSDQPVLLGRMGAALVRGVKPNAMACVKHFALNSMENARFDVDVTCDETTMHEDFLPHFKEAIDAGAEAVMCAYNSVNGHWASESTELLTDILRTQWGFDGFVLSDFIWAIRDAAASLEAGMDLEAPFAQLRADRLPAEIREGRTSFDAVRRAVVHILTAQLRYYAERDRIEPSADLIAGPAHRALACKVAQHSMVLLRNEDVAGDPALPIDAGFDGRVAVLGKLADAVNLGDKGSSNVNPPSVVTVLDGIRSGLPQATVDAHDGSDLDRAAEVAAGADVTVVVVGYTAAEEGEWVNGRVYGRDDLMGLYPEPATDEDRRVYATMMQRLEVAKGKPEAGGDRRDLRLPSADVALIRAACAASPRTIVVVQSAGAVIIDDWADLPDAIVLMWYWPTTSTFRFSPEGTARTRSGPSAVPTDLAAAGDVGAQWIGSATRCSPLRNDWPRPSCR
ncbi:beta-glucosidase [Tessaracoccus bendigoensis DSM 12906]|uniref:Beta-glucosidase n=1 Tax=Tessaracoccus bendigoensis DSM 12906 TaxID=1123357 RepID=A0A1M6EPM8_9ACTN|nr:glycoside hydrolase family 3 protein [Tessaracoccus bendigoensis]SHI87230.1 beta-glucosidase [Tessaracoccus bendigoensis DSM 12906]